MGELWHFLVFVFRSRSELRSQWELVVHWDEHVMMKLERISDIMNEHEHYCPICGEKWPCSDPNCMIEDDWDKYVMICDNCDQKLVPDPEGVI